MVLSPVPVFYRLLDCSVVAAAHCQTTISLPGGSTGGQLGVDCQIEPANHSPTKQKLQLPSPGKGAGAP